MIAAAVPRCGPVLLGEAAHHERGRLCRRRGVPRYKEVRNRSRPPWASSRPCGRRWARRRRPCAGAAAPDRRPRRRRPGGQGRRSSLRAGVGRSPYRVRAVLCDARSVLRFSSSGSRFFRFWNGSLLTISSTSLENFAWSAAIASTILSRAHLSGSSIPRPIANVSIFSARQRVKFFSRVLRIPLSPSGPWNDWPEGSEPELSIEETPHPSHASRRSHRSSQTRTRAGPSERRGTTREFGLARCCSIRCRRLPVSVAPSSSFNSRHIRRRRRGRGPENLLEDPLPAFDRRGARGVRGHR